MSSIHDQLAKTANAYVSGFNNPGLDVAGVVAARTLDCQHFLLPANLNTPPMSNEDYIAYSKKLRTYLHDFTIELANGSTPVIDEAQRKVLLHLKGNGQSTFGPYANEYFVLLHMTENGEQIWKVEEFLDTGYTTHFLQRLGGFVLTS